LSILEEKSEYTNGNEYANNSGNDTLTAVKGNISAVKDKVSEQATELKGKLSAQANNLSNQLTQKIDNARGKTSAGLRNTSQRIQNLAMYVEEHDAKDMSEAVARTSQELIRKHPGKSILVGLVIGMLVGRIFSLGNSGNSRQNY
jgi:ElaB/YqjD/DUF883 family membrane-anchored ribosome-binding protein